MQVSILAQVQAGVEVAAGSEEEIEIRASTVAATERLRSEIQRVHRCSLHSVQLDWWLWGEGEKNRSVHRRHHMTRTIFY